MNYINTLFIIFFTFIGNAFSAAPDINCGWLPGCERSDNNLESIYSVVWNFISLMIQYIAVLAVLAVMLGGIMYLISAWDEEKAKKAKNIIIWALVWVFLSVTAWSIIGILNNFSIT